MRAIYGIGKYQSQVICSSMGINPNTRLNTLYHSYGLITKTIEHYVEPKALQYRHLGENISAKIKNQSYEGQRHQYCLPLNGQKNANHKTQQRLGLIRAKLFSFPLAKPKKQNRKK